MLRADRTTRWWTALLTTAVLSCSYCLCCTIGNAQDETALGVCRDGSCPTGPSTWSVVPAAPEANYPAGVHLKLPLESVVRIRHRQADGAGREIASWGTGTIVRHGGQTLVVTCAHLFRGVVGTIEVFRRDRSTGKGVLLDVDNAYDLAAIEISAPAVTASVVADGFSPVASTSIAVGYGPEGRLSQRPGRVLGYTRSGTARLAQTMVCSGAAQQGDSGGPVFNQQGQLTAVLWGSTGSETYATCCLRVREFLSGAIAHRRGSPRIPASRDQEPASRAPIAQAPRSSDNRLQQQLAELERKLAASQQRTSQIAQQLQDVLRTQRDRAAGDQSTANQPLTADAHDNAATPDHGIGDVLSAVASRWLSSKATALLIGFGVPGWIALLIVWVFKRRAKRKLAGVASRTAQDRKGSRPRKLNDDYAGQLLEVFAQSGRSPVQDATLGREYDQAIRSAEESSDAQLARWAKALRSRVEGKFMRIHGPAPAPAEPVLQTQ